MCETKGSDHVVNSSPLQSPSRRSVVRTLGAAALLAGLPGCSEIELGGIGAPSTGEQRDDLNDSHSPSPDEPTETPLDFETAHETYKMVPGTVYETTVHVLESAAEGPTAMVLGGVHGNEVSGIAAAHTVTEYSVGRGKLVVIPETNKPAVDAETRSGPDGDLNRQFPADQGPTTEIAQAVWEQVRRHDPTCLIDMHNSKGVFRLHEDSVGQVVFPHGGQVAVDDAQAVAERVNEYLAPLLGDELPEEYDFQAVHGEHNADSVTKKAENRMLVSSASQVLGLNAWLTEVTYRGFDLEEQVFQHDRLTTGLLARNGMPIESPLDDVDNPLLDGSPSST